MSEVLDNPQTSPFRIFTALDQEQSGFERVQLSLARDPRDPRLLMLLSGIAVEYGKKGWDDRVTHPLEKLTVQQVSPIK